MSDLLKINVNDHTERKNNLTYLSWAWAWAEVLKADPEATWEAVDYPAADGTRHPCLYVGDGSALVKTIVTIRGKARSCILPVMDHRNKAIKNPDAFAINTATMRCMTKAISMHGLGLYIYAGEDLPEGEETAGDEKPGPIPATFRSSPTMGEIETLTQDELIYIRELADAIEGAFSLTNGSAVEDREAMVRRVEGECLEDTQKMALWSLLSSKTRTAFKKVQQAAKEAATA